MNNYRERLIKALIKFYEGGIEAHIIETLDAEVEKLSALEDKLEAINKHFLK
jgi:hypothetical protein